MQEMHAQKDWEGGGSWIDCLNEKSKFIVNSAEPGVTQYIM